jgi:predicted HicB family RNase H-like nuclease
MKERKPDKARMGRPPLPEGKARTVQIIFRAEPSLYESIAAAARREGKPVATWIRDVLATLLRSK